MDVADAGRSVAPPGLEPSGGPSPRSRLLAVAALVVGALTLVAGAVLVLRDDGGDDATDEVAVADMPASTESSTSTPTAVVASDETIAEVPDDTAGSVPPTPGASVVSGSAAAPALPPPTFEEAPTTTVWVLTFATCAVPPVGSPVSAMYPEGTGTALPCKTESGISFGGINSLGPPQASVAIPEYSPDFIFALGGVDVIVGWVTKADQWSHRDIDAWTIPLYDSDFATRIGWLVGGAGVEPHFEPL